MRLENHRIAGIPFHAARHQGGVIMPEIVILHDTASRLDRGNAARYLQDNDAKVSVHFVVERDGSIEQQVDTNRRANHAGVSSFNGRSGCNDFSIGIEIVNPGKMDVVPGLPDHGRTWWGDILPGAERVSTPEHGEGMWLRYTPEQITAVTLLLEALFSGIPSLTDITTHWYVSPGRKVDTNPLFPLEQVRSKVLGHDDPADLEAMRGSKPEPVEMGLKVETAGSGLNLRRWPSLNPNIIGSIPNGTILPAIRSGVFDGRRWWLTSFDGREGWVVDTYVSMQ